jgi:superfamily II DNA or RNA helicase
LAALRSIRDLKPIYFVPREDIAAEVLIPCLSNAVSVSCMVGFFSGHSFSILAPGLASFIAASSEPLRLVICPVLRPEDREAIAAGCSSPEEVIREFLASGLTVEEGLARHTLRCLAYLISVGRVEIRIALLRDAIFHPKVWLISDGNDTVAIHGSSNLTVTGLSKNFEQISVTRSWTDENSNFVVEKLKAEFDAIWTRRSAECQVFDFPEAVARTLLREYSGTQVPTEDELLAIMEEEPLNKIAATRGCTFRIPPHLNYTAGDFAHQGRAADAFEAHGFRGILAMATGSGKTITSMIAAHRLFRREGKLLIVVAAPYLPLIAQWCDEISEFGLTPRNLSLVSGARQRNAELTTLARRVRMSSEPAAEAVVVTHNTVCDGTFQEALARADVPVLLIADEVHNFGRDEFIDHPPESVPFRLGLSATPERQYDPEGTGALFRYFGEMVFSFTLEQAIGVCLVPYDYYLHRLELSATELDEWMELTEKIKREMWKGKSEGGEDSPYLQLLLQRRRLVLESAEAKLRILSELLDQESRDLKFTLIYATDKDPNQLQRVNELLREKRIRFHELTSEETCDRKLTARIVAAFRGGDLQVLTAKRVLDEGVNIPQISKAFVLASTTVERQWVQRRGRLLRKCNEIGKRSSIIHDFFVVPPDGQIDKDTRKIVKGELARIREFSRLSGNFGSPGGPASVIHPIVERFFSDTEEIYATD